MIRLILKPVKINHTRDVDTIRQVALENGYYLNLEDAQHIWLLYLDKNSLPWSPISKSQVLEVILEYTKPSFE